MWRRGPWRGGRTTLESTGEVHGRLEILRVAQLDVHADVVREAADEQLRLLRGGEVPRMAQDGVEALGVILHRGDEGQACQLGEARAVERRAKRRVHSSLNWSQAGKPSSCSRA